MAIKLKPLHKQVMLITGASSGIGLTTARLAAEQGAKVILVSRNQGALDQAVREIQEAGGEAFAATADVANLDQLRRAAEAGRTHFGTIDTWVNNAGVSVIGKIDQVSVEDDRRLFETNFWGVVNGSRIAAEMLKDTGGALINVGSELSEVSIPLQGMYSASKHAVLGFTDAFRMELEADKMPISVTTIKPAGMDTPYMRHAKNYTDKEPTLPAPVYAPELAAQQILHAATTPVRDLYVGGAARLMSALGRHFPEWMDWFMEKTMIGQQQTDRPADRSNEGLGESRGGHSERGDASRDHNVRETSTYNFFSRNATLVTVAAGVVSAVVAYLVLKPAADDESPTKRYLRENLRDPLGRVADTARSRIEEYLR